MSINKIGGYGSSYSFTINSPKKTELVKNDSEQIRKTANEIRQIENETEQIKQLGYKIGTPDFYGNRKS